MDAPNAPYKQPKTMLEKLREAVPELNNLPDPQFVEAMRQFVHPKSTPEDWNTAIGYTPITAKEDFFKSLGTGAMHGLADIATMPGNMLGMTNDMGDWLYSNFTGKPPPQHVQPLPTSEDLSNMLAKDTGINLHQPQTPIGEWAETGGRGISAVVPFSGARTGAQVVTNALRYGAAPALAGKEAGDLARTYAPDAEAVVRAVTPVLTGGVGSLSEKAPGRGLVDSRTPNKGYIPHVDLEKLKRDNYDAANAAGVVVKPQAVKSIVRDLQKVARSKGYDAARTSPHGDQDWAKVRDLHEKFNDVANTPMTLEELDHLRRRVNKAASVNDSEASGAAMAMKNAMDKHIDSLNSAHIAGGADPAQSVRYLKEGRRLANMGFKSEFIQDMINDANTEAKAKGGLSLPQRLRDKFAILAKNEDLMKTFSPAERKAIYAVVGGNKIRDAARFAAKFAPTSPFGGAIALTVGSILGGAEGTSNFTDWGHAGGHGVTAAGTIAGAGMLGKGADYNLTRRAADTAEAVTRGAKAPGPRDLMSTSEMVNSNNQREEKKHRDYSGNNPLGDKPTFTEKPLTSGTPLEITATTPANVDEINKWRIQNDLPPIVDKPPFVSQPDNAEPGYEKFFRNLSPPTVP